MRQWSGLNHAGELPGGRFTLTMWNRLLYMG